MASIKFLGFRRNVTRPFDFQDQKRWQADGRSYKLISPDLEADRMFATAELKVAKESNPDDRLYIAGVANANIVDRMQERLNPVGCEVAHYLKNAQLLAHHSYFHPIGQVEALEITEDGVNFKAWIGDPKRGELTPMQKEMRSLVAQGILKTVSVGFIPKKVRPPLFDDQGNMQEPLVIEAWELLELSIVAVPCNQDSVFEVRDYRNEKQSAKVKTDTQTAISFNEKLAETITAKLSSYAEKNLVVESLIFSKDSFNEEQATEWAKGYGFKADAVREVENAFIIAQDDPEAFDKKTFETVDLSEGVQAVVAKKKESPNEGDAVGQPSEVEQQMIGMLQSMSETLQMVSDTCGKMLEKMSQEPAEEKPAAEEGEDEKSVTDTTAAEVHEIKERMGKLETRIEKVVKALEVLAKKAS